MNASANFTDTSQFTRIRRGRTSGMIITLLGALIFLIGIKPALFGLDRSPVIGFIQIEIFLIGLGLICLGGYIGISGLWGDTQRGIIADLGLRLIATGYVVCVFTGMADLFGMGSHISPMIPYFGFWQALGVELGESMIAIGFLMFIPFGRKK